MNLRRRTTCRVCGSSALRQVIDLGPQYLQGSFRKEGMPSPPERKIPCTLVRCCPEEDENACGLLQMQHSVPPEILYSTYWYESGVNHTMRNHLRGIVESVTSMLDLDSGNALDIGCNDCTLLNCFSDSWNLVGVDPSGIEFSDRRNLKVHKNLFPSREIKGRSYDVITSIAMFYDIEDPVDFAREVFKLLSYNGIWVLEVAYLPMVLDRNMYDGICHEHLSFFSLSVIERICKYAGLKVVRADFNESNGGSIRCYITHQASDCYDNTKLKSDLQKIRTDEFDRQLDTDSPYISFQKRIEQQREALRSLLLGYQKDRKSVHVLGASTKGNTLLQFCGLDSQTIQAASDRNPHKRGAMTLGTNIPIISEAESRAMKPDVYLVLPYHFKEELVEREKDFLENGGVLVFPLPIVSIVCKDNLR